MPFLRKSLTRTKRSAVFKGAREASWVFLFCTFFDCPTCMKSFDLNSVREFCEVSDVLCFSSVCSYCLLACFCSSQWLFEDVSLELLFVFLRFNFSYVERYQQDCRIHLHVTLRSNSYFALLTPVLNFS